VCFKNGKIALLKKSKAQTFIYKKNIAIFPGQLSPLYRYKLVQITDCVFLPISTRIEPDWRSMEVSLTPGCTPILPHSDSLVTCSWPTFSALRTHGEHSYTPDHRRPLRKHIKDSPVLKRFFPASSQFRLPGCSPCCLHLSIKHAQGCCMWLHHLAVEYLLW